MYFFSNKPPSPNTVLVALSTIASEQSSATFNTAKKITQLLNYLATHPDATIRYKRSGMVLWVHSDASYFSCPKARSRAGGMHFLSDKPPSPNNPANFEPTLNGIVYVVCKILLNIMASDAEVKLGDLFLNCRESVPIRITLEEMRHPQRPSPVGWTGFPIDVELVLISYIPNPIEPHVHCFGLALLDYAGCYSQRSGVLNLNRGRRLGMLYFF